MTRKAPAEKIKEGLLDALEYAKGDADRGETHVVDPDGVDIKALRKRLGMSQNEFADEFGFTRATLRNYEQGRRAPVGPAAVLLLLIQTDPTMVKRTIKRALKEVA